MGQVLYPAHRVDVEKGCRQPHDQRRFLGFTGGRFVEGIHEVEHRVFHQFAVSFEHELLFGRIEATFHMVGIRTLAAVAVQELVDSLRCIIVHTPNGDSSVERARHGSLWVLGGSLLVVWQCNERMKGTEVEGW